MNSATQVVLSMVILAGGAYRWMAVNEAPRTKVATSLCPRLFDDADVREIRVRGDKLQWTAEDGAVHNLQVAGTAPPRVQLQISRWDQDAPVYVTAGQDRQPGAAGIDDDGNGVTDDRQELGATGTDDEVLTPKDSQYEQAHSGDLPALVLSRGAMRRIDGDSRIEAPAQVRIDCIVDQQHLSSRILDLDAS
ncbi:MAG: hypothetical protein ACO1RT_08495 [Planctomycetaceae bacterium]